MKSMLNIALLGNVSTEYLGNEIKEECSRYFIEANIYNAPYMQYNQEVLNRSSNFYTFNPELTILFLEGSELFPYWYESTNLIAETAHRKKQVQDMLDILTHLIEVIHKYSNTRIIINNFRIPYHSPLGILDTRQAIGLKYMISLLNLKLEEYAANTDFAYIFDYNGYCSHIGQCDPQDHKMYYLAKVVLSYSSIKLTAHEYMRYILPLKACNKKCLVLDLDDTLWGGIAGEDGISGINLDISGTGRSYYTFQKELLNLYHKGILLAINSKNNPEDAVEIIENHPHMLLRKNYFASVKINWQDKVTNLLEIARELNIGLDSLVFFDDNPVEREFVKSSLPMVTVIDVPVDSCKYCSTLKDIIEFESLGLTKDDIQRNELYKINKARQELEKKSTSKEEYLESLQTKMIITYADQFTIPRIAQLTQKTNQFNMTTRRYQVADIENMSKSSNHLVLCCSVSDKFGDIGIVGCIIAELEGSNAHIDTLLLSCRVLGREVEYAFLYSVVKLIRLLGFKNITSEYIFTEKSKMNRDFYLKAGFSIFEEKNGNIKYALGVDTWPTESRYIEIDLRGHTSKYIPGT